MPPALRTLATAAQLERSCCPSPSYDVLCPTVQAAKRVSAPEHAVPSYTFASASALL